MSHSGNDRKELQFADNRGLLEYLGSKCEPLQYIREYTRTAIDAIRRSGGDGQVLWGRERVRLDAGSGELIPKLCVSDNGVGMTGPEMAENLGQIGRCADPRRRPIETGIGPLMAAAYWHPVGVRYVSWTNGQAATVQVERGPDGFWRLRRSPEPAGLDRKPAFIEQHGTKVIFLGTDPDNNTAAPPDEASAGEGWVARYLNTRFYQVPEGITIRAA